MGVAATTAPPLLNWPSSWGGSWQQPAVAAGDLASAAGGRMTAACSTVCPSGPPVVADYGARFCAAVAASAASLAGSFLSLLKDDNKFAISILSHKLSYICNSVPLYAGQPLPTPQIGWQVTVQATLLAFCELEQSHLIENTWWMLLLLSSS
jgi:hypothetical protein